MFRGGLAVNSSVEGPTGDGQRVGKGKPREGRSGCLGWGLVEVGAGKNGSLSTSSPLTELPSSTESAEGAKDTCPLLVDS